MRMLVVFEKGPQLRHIGHLDLMRLMQRVLRRTNLPVAYSQGFNPHMVMNFAAPLSVGASGLREIMDVALSKEVAEETFLAALSPCLPAALKALSTRAIPDTYPAPMSRLHAASYELKAFDPSAEALMKAIPAFLALGEIPAMRKTKSGEKPCDIRPMIYSLSAERKGDAVLFEATLAFREQATLKPDLLMESLGKFCASPVPDYALVRTGLHGLGPDGALVPLESL